MPEPSPPLVDGIAPPPPEEERPAPDPAPQPPVSIAARRRMRVLLLLLLGIPYLLYVLWSFFLLSVLPDATGKFNVFLQPGILVAAVVAVVLLGIGVLGYMRLSAVEGISLFRRRIGMVRLAVLVFPALILSAVVPFFITREPPLTIAITSPASQEDLVAPVPVTFSLSGAVAILNRKGFVPEKYIWDFEGDGQMNEQTIDPTVTAQYDKQGSYTVAVTIYLKGGSVRRVTLRLVIPDAVFSVTPWPPILDEPVRFSVEQIVEKKEDVENVQWDFDENDEPEVTTTDLSVAHTFYAEGPVKVKAILKMKNGAIRTIERTIEVSKAPPLPFDVKVITQPEILVSPAPFGVLFRAETQEKVRIILWNYGDGSEARGERVGHTFERQGIYPVTAEIRTEDGKVAKIVKVVRIVQKLDLPDLSFMGTPEVKSGKISGEVPVTVNLKPRTNMPLIDFQWEAPDATSVGSTKNEVQAVYRREGSYTLTLLAQGPDSKALRVPISVEVLPLSNLVTILMNPEGGVAPVKVRFDASETSIPGEEITGFEWVFSDEKETGPLQRGAQVEHTFKQPGTFEVGAKVFTTSGKTFESKKTIVIREPIMDACISASRTEGKVPLGVLFSSDCSTMTAGATFVWDFGDGWTSDQKNPTHDFQKAGTYTVTLTLRAGNSVSTSDPLSITVKQP
ncbi:MAG: PKD domain-containing protein [Candidatus Peribacteraceae bacterium]|nr:PKD domain-containing protein [Candidatus Peribacteraceae bacterium]